MCHNLYLRHACEHVPSVSPFNFSSYSPDPRYVKPDVHYAHQEAQERYATQEHQEAQERYAENASQEHYAAQEPKSVYVDPLYAEPFVDDLVINDIHQMTNEILGKVDEIEVLLNIDRRLAMGDFVKETCPAIEKLNYTCPRTVCPTYTVVFERDYGLVYAFLGVLIVVAAWLKRAK